MQPLQHVATTDEPTSQVEMVFSTLRRTVVGIVALATVGCATAVAFKISKMHHGPRTHADLSSPQFLMGASIIPTSLGPNQELCCSTGSFDLQSCCAGMQPGVNATTNFADTADTCSGTIKCNGKDADADSSSSWSCDCDSYSAAASTSSSSQSNQDDDENHDGDDHDHDDNCFPGDATVFVNGLGAVPLGRLEPHAEVLVQRGSTVGYEPAIGFLHVVHPTADQLYNIMVVTHSTGEFKATANHLVFIMVNGYQTSKMVKDLRVGDELLATDILSMDITKSVVVSIGHSVASSLYAPLTQAGTLVVDGVIASIYASPGTKYLSHGLAHAMLFPVRAVHWLGLSGLLLPSEVQRSEPNRLHEMHAYAKFLRYDLRLDKLLPMYSW